MNKKEDISFDWLQRYTGTNPNDYGEWILLTNFHNYVENFQIGLVQKLMVSVGQ